MLSSKSIEACESCLISFSDFNSHFNTLCGEFNQLIFSMLLVFTYFELNISDLLLEFVKVRLQSFQLIVGPCFVARHFCLDLGDLTRELVAVIRYFFDLRTNCFYFFKCCSVDSRC